MGANTVSSTPTTETAPEDVVGDTHIHYDVGYKAAFAEIASLFEEIRDDMAIIKDRLDDRQKGFHVREADVVAGNPANIAMQAGMVAALRESGIETAINQEIQRPTNFGDTSVGSYGGVTNTGTRGGMVGSSNPSTPGRGNSAPAVTDPATGTTTNLDGAALSALTPTGSDAQGKVTINPSAPRALGIQPQLKEILQTAAEAAGVDVRVTSGGQVPASRGGVVGRTRTGSNRHDLGYAADVAIYDGTGKRLRTDRSKEDLEVVIKFLEACRDAGATAIGAGNGYMENQTYHVDIAWLGEKAGAISGISPARYWGGGRFYRTETSTANSPRWLVDLMAPRVNT